MAQRHNGISANSGHGTYANGASGGSIGSIGGAAATLRKQELEPMAERIHWEAVAAAAAFVADRPIAQQKPLL